jgi:hypothetical protein
VQDREAQYKTVESILAEAALANAQLAVAKAVPKAEFRREGTSAEEAAVKAEKAVEKMARQLVFGQVTVQTKAKQRRIAFVKPEIKVVYFRSLVDAAEGEDRMVLPPTGQPVQLAMIAPELCRIKRGRDLVSLPR